MVIIIIWELKSLYLLLSETAQGAGISGISFGLFQNCEELTDWANGLEWEQLNNKMNEQIKQKKNKSLWKPGGDQAYSTTVGSSFSR